MTDWTEGYVSDIQYIPGFFSELAPTRLAYATLVASKRPALPETGARYLELGCGQGFGTALLAAANPEMSFTGIDFNPAQIANARRMATQAGLTNIEFKDYSFAETLERGLNGVAYDFAVLHGIYSWISKENRDAIVEILARSLTPGGLAYVSYNCLPGWAHSMPLQRLLREHAGRVTARSDKRMAGALEFAKSLMDGGAGYFSANPQAKNRLEKIPSQNPNYLAHEYLNEHWNPLYVTDVAAEMATARLNFITSATLAESLDGVSVPKDLQETIKSEQDLIWRELLRDFACNKQFRRDIYARGVNEYQPHELGLMLGKTLFALAVPRADVSFKFMGPMGEISGQDVIYGPLCDLLDGKPRSFNDIMSLPIMQERGTGSALQALTLLVGSHQAAVFFTFSKVNPAPAQAFNRMVVDEYRMGRTFNAICSSIAKTGLTVTPTDLLFLSALFDGKNDIQSAARHAYGYLTKVGRRVLKDGAQLTEEVEAVAHLESLFEPIVSRRLPVWRALGAV